MPDIQTAKLTPQLYGLAMAQCTFGGPRGIWLECTECPKSEAIVGSNSDEWMALSDAEVSKVFKRHGWTGEGVSMKKAKCPVCSQSPSA